MPRGGAVFAIKPKRTTENEENERNKKKRLDENKPCPDWFRSDYATPEQKEALKKEEESIWTKDLVVQYSQVLEAVQRLGIVKDERPIVPTLGMTCEQERNRANEGITILAIYLFARINAGPRTKMMDCGTFSVVYLAFQNPDMLKLFETLKVPPLVIERESVPPNMIISWLVSRGYNGLAQRVSRYTGYVMSRSIVTLKDAPWKQTLAVVDSTVPDSQFKLEMVQCVSTFNPTHYLDTDFSKTVFDEEKLSFSEFHSDPMPVFNHPDCKGIKVVIFKKGTEEVFLTFTFSSERITCSQVRKVVQLARTRNSLYFLNVKKFQLLPRKPGHDEFTGNTTVEFDIE
jgi:hypothetical protein